MTILPQFIPSTESLRIAKRVAHLHVHRCIPAEQEYAVSRQLIGCALN